MFLLLFSENCGVDVRDFINEDLNAVLRCSMLENCWGISCCIEFSFDLPLSSEHIVMSTPVLFRIDPCEYFVEAEVGTWTTKKHFLKYNWGMFFNYFSNVSIRIILT